MLISEGEGRIALEEFMMHIYRALGGNTAFRMRRRDDVNSSYHGVAMDICEVYQRT